MARLALIGLALLLMPGLLYAQSDEETTLIRRAEPEPASDDEETTLLRRPAGDDDEETSLVRRAAPDDDDEGTSLIRRPSTVSTSLASNSTSTARFFSSRIQGYWYEKWGLDTAHEGNGEDVFDLRSRFGLAAEVTTPDRVKVYLAGRFSHTVVGETNDDDGAWYLFNSERTKWEYEPELLEAYLYWPNKAVNLRIGNQIVRWGQGQFNKPSDVLNSTDYREGLFSDLEVPLVPNFMVHLDRTVGPVNISGVWIPFFQPNKSHLFGNDWGPMAAMQGNPAFASMSGMSEMVGLVGNLVSPLIEDDIQPILLATHPPDERPEDGQFGTSIETSFLGIDLQAIYFYGWDKLPTIHLNQEFVADLGTVGAFAGEHGELLGTFGELLALDTSKPDDLVKAAGIFNSITPEEKAAMGEAFAAINRMLYDETGAPRELSLDSLFSTRYERQHTVGLSLSTVLFDTVGLKVDSAFSPKRTLYLETATGFPQSARKPTLSYSVGLDYRLGTWFDVMAEFYHFSVLDLDAGEEVFILGDQLMMVTLATHLRFLDFDALEFQVAGMMEVLMQNLFLFPKVSYKFTDTVRLGVGAMIIEVLPGGDEMGPAGLYDRNDGVYGEFKWSF